jgi:hypothetical protein
MREKQNQPFQLSFNAALKIDCQGSRVTSDGGLILVRELDERLGLGELIEQHLRDPRRGRTTWGTCGGVSSQPSALCALPGRNLAASWTKARRVVAKVEYHCGERFPRVGFIGTPGCWLVCHFALDKISAITRRMLGAGRDTERGSAQSGGRLAPSGWPTGSVVSGGSLHSMAGSDRV